MTVIIVVLVIIFHVVLVHIFVIFVVLGIVIFTTGWSAVVDVQLFQKAIAANPANTMGGYMLGGLCWFSIPFCLATTFGLVARALQNNPAFPTYPRAMTADEVNAGLAVPFAAQALLGKVSFLLIIGIASCNLKSPSREAPPRCF